MPVASSIALRLAQVEAASPGTAPIFVQRTARPVCSGVRSSRTMAGVAIFFAAAILAGAPEHREVEELYRRGLLGDKAAVEQCIAQLEEIVHAQPENQIARVYLGSAYTLRSRDLGFGPNKLQALRQGLAVMDEAVAAAPADPKVRLARALTTSALPGIFGRGRQSREDFAWLARLAREHPERFSGEDFGAIDEHTRK